MTSDPQPQTSPSAIDSYTSFLVRPSGPLSGTVNMSGAKNSVLKLMAATLLAEGSFRLDNVPEITDVFIMGELLATMGLDVTHGPGTVDIVCPSGCSTLAPYEIVGRIRASIVVLGPLLARFGEAKVALPGGDDFGSRPIDMHLRGLEALGATFTTEHGYVIGKADHLIGADILLDFPSVGATENIMMAAVRAKGLSTIDNAAREPEISDLANFLNSMGANITGAGTSTITVEGVDSLTAADHTVVSDRLEAATYMAALAAAHGEIRLQGAVASNMDMLCQKLSAMGMQLLPDDEGITAIVDRRLTSVDVSTLPYPGVATDYKPMVVSTLALADGVGIVTENLYAGRFAYVSELQRMGADIRIDGHHAVVRGVERLSGAPVKAHDIRAGACLVVAALAAEGETLVTEAHHIDRGYTSFVEKLAGIGVSIERVSQDRRRSRSGN